MTKVVLGGGISGLSAAYYLRAKFPKDQIYLIEASSRTGGWIGSTRLEGGLIFEQGPRTIRPRGPKGANTLHLIEQLGLSSEIQAIPSNHPAALNRMVYANGQLHTLPSSIFSIFKRKAPFSKPLISYIANDLKAPRKVIPSNDESIYSFIQRRFGTELADYAISPLICGICAGSSEQISVKFLMENLFDYEQRHGSVIKGAIMNAVISKNNSKQREPSSSLSKRAKEEKWSVYSFKQGLVSLPKKLEEINEKNKVQIRLNTQCTQIEFTNKITIHTANGEKIIADHLISCISSKLLGKLIQGHTEFKELLKSIPFVNVGVINLHYNKKVLNHNGFGFLVPPKENLPILGVIFDSCCFPQGDSTTLTVMMGGHWFQHYFGDNPSKDYLLDVALLQLCDILGICEKPTVHRVNILKDCIPQYVVGHNDTVNRINTYIKTNNMPLSLCGASYNGVGINDVIFSAKTTVDNM